RLTPEQTDAARALREALENDPDLRRLGTQEYREGGLGLEGEEEDVDEEEGVEDMELLGQQERVVPLQEPLTSYMSRFRVPRIQTLICRLLGLLFTQLPCGVDTKWFSPIAHYVVYSSRRMDGTFRGSSQITQIIAAITFIGRLYMFSVIREHVVNNPDMRYPE